MKIRVWVSLNKVGCRSEIDIELSQDELSQLKINPERPEESPEFQEVCLDAMWEMVEWGWKVVD